jgi:hypothetical protein
MARLYDPANVREATSCECNPRTMPPMWVLDRIADEKFSGGFDVRKSNVCPNCFEARSVNGACGC